MRAKSLAGALLVVAVAACSAKDGLVTAPEVADAVTVTVTAPGHCILATCTPEPDGRKTLGLIEITNTGIADAFLQACGSEIALGEAVFLDGKWTLVGPAVDCAAPSTPVRIAAGQTLQFNKFFAPGLRRMAVGVSTSANFADADATVSNTFYLF